MFLAGSLLTAVRLLVPLLGRQILFLLPHHGSCDAGSSPANELVPRVPRLGTVWQSTRAVVHQFACRVHGCKCVWYLRIRIVSVRFVFENATLVDTP